MAGEVRRDQQFQDITVRLPVSLVERLGETARRCSERRREPRGH